MRDFQHKRPPPQCIYAYSIHVTCMAVSILLTAQLDIIETLLLLGWNPGLTSTLLGVCINLHVQ